MSDKELSTKVERLTNQVETLLKVLAPVITGRRSIAKQAKAAGCHRSTLWRRKRRASAELTLQSR